MLPHYTFPDNPLGRDLLSKLKGLIHFVSNGNFTLKFPDQPEPDLLCSLQYVLATEEKEFPERPPTLTKLPKFYALLLILSFGRIKSAECIKTQMDMIKPLPKLAQYPFKPEAILGITLTVEDLIA